MSAASKPLCQIKQVMTESGSECWCVVTMSDEARTLMRCAGFSDACWGEGNFPFSVGEEGCRKAARSAGLKVVDQLPYDDPLAGSGEYGHEGGTGPRPLSHPFWVMVNETYKLQAGGEATRTRQFVGVATLEEARKQVLSLRTLASRGKGILSGVVNAAWVEQETRTVLDL